MGRFCFILGIGSPARHLISSPKSALCKRALFIGLFPPHCGIGASFKPDLADKSLDKSSTIWYISYMLPRLCSLNLLDRHFSIRLGAPDDVSDCDRIARLQERIHPSSLGWVRRSDYAHFHVGLLDGEVVGFVIFETMQRGADAGFQVIKALAVDPRYEGLGIGRNLLYSVECPIRLRCPQQVGGLPNPSNRFYANAGLKQIDTETVYRGGPKRGQDRANSLYVWQLTILPVLVMGSNREMPEASRQSGWGYGLRSTEIPRDWPYQVDLEFSEDWRSFDWTTYLDKIRRWKPFAALVMDYFEPDQRQTMLQQVKDLRAAGVMRVLVCPKFVGAVKDIPEDCVVAISIPSRYAGFVPPLHELAGRKLHLLGGSPPSWLGSKSKGRRGHSSSGYVTRFIGAGARVISVDGNSHEAAAQSGTYWQSGLWKRPFNGTHWVYGNRFNTLVQSGKNIAEELQGLSHVEGQLALF